MKLIVVIFGIAGLNVLLWCNMMVNAAPFRYKGGGEYHHPTQPSSHYHDNGEPRDAIEYKKLYEKARRNGRLHEERGVYDYKLPIGGDGKERKEAMKDRVTIPQKHGHDSVREFKRLREEEDYRNRKQHLVEKEEKERSRLSHFNYRERMGEEEEEAEQSQSYKEDGGMHIKDKYGHKKQERGDYYREMKVPDKNRKEKYRYKSMKGEERMRPEEKMKESYNDMPRREWERKDRVDNYK